MKKYFLYVRRFSLSGDYKLFVYRVETDNVYRIIGKIFVTSLEEIQRIDFTRWSKEKEAFWEEQGVEIIDYLEPVLSEDEDEE